MSFTIFLFAIILALTTCAITHTLYYDFDRIINHRSIVLIMFLGCFLSIVTLFLSFNFECFQHLFAYLKYDNVKAVVITHGYRSTMPIDTNKIIYEYDNFLTETKTIIMAWNNINKYDKLVSE